jgi:hypothetical protein
MALGCSTNSVLHLLAIANEAGVPVDLSTVERRSAATPNLCKLSPAGDHHIQDLHRAGGVPAVMKQLLDAGLIDGTLPTVTGSPVADNVSMSVVLDPSVVRPVSDPHSPTGGIAILRGNLAPEGAVVKRSAVDPRMMDVTCNARVFNSEDDAIEAIYAGNIHAGDVVVIRYEGPGAPRDARNARTHLGARGHGSRQGRRTHHGRSLQRCDPRCRDRTCFQKPRWTDRSAFSGKGTGSGSTFRTECWRWKSTTRSSLDGLQKNPLLSRGSFRMACALSASGYLGVRRCGTALTGNR